MNDKFRKMSAVIPALIFWQIAAMYLDSSILLVSPWDTAIRLGTIWKEPGFLQAVFFTLGHIAAGFGCGWLIGCMAAVLAYRSQWIEYLLWPWMAAVKSVPAASFIVICLIWLSPVKLSGFISFLMVLPFVYTNLLTGIRGQSREMEEMAVIFRISPVRRLWYLIMPQMKPYILSALKVTCGLAWKAGLAAEIIGTPGGSMGQKMYLAKMYLDTDDLLAWTIVIVVLSVCSEKLLLFAAGFLPGMEERE
ncbi:MAG: ABC transporter permease subunit [Eubacteriales bacterium]|nr:ABC transporter permease subunit [Eubacteriales bacterium]